MIDKHKDYNQTSELVDEVETLFFRCAQFPLLTATFDSSKFKFWNFKIFLYSLCTFKCANKVMEIKACLS